MKTLALRKRKLWSFVYLSIIIFFFSSLLPSCSTPKEVCFNEQNIETVKENFAKEYFKIMMEKFGIDRETGEVFFKFFGGETFDEALNSFKKSLQVVDKLSATREGDIYTCKIVISIPQNNENSNLNESLKFTVVYQIEKKKENKNNKVKIVDVVPQ